MSKENIVSDEAYTLWSVRMRASKRAGRGQSIHISGAEGLFEMSEIERVLKGYVVRAIGHPRGTPDMVIVTLEKTKQRPLNIPLLPFSTLQCSSPEGAQRVIQELLSGAGISRKAIRHAIGVVTGKAAMRGASLLRARSGIRVEPDRNRGVRVSMLGTEKGSEKVLSKRLALEGIDTPTVKEAMILASKVASCKGIIAELCVSDDPHYTTGYVSSRKLGYVRIANIKEEGSLCGGRVFFISEKSDERRIIGYLEGRPVIVGMRAG